MAAYAAMISLSNTIHRIQNHNRLSISLAENQQLLSLLEYVNSFEAFLEKFPDKFNSLEGIMRNLAHEAEDIIEYFMLDQVSSWPDYHTKDTKLWLEQYIRDGVEWRANSSSTAPTICDDSMVGFEDDMIDLKGDLCGEPSKLRVIPICGMAGTGKTTLARNVYDDPSVVDHFVIRVWVTVSQYASVLTTLSRLLECLKEFCTNGLGLGQSDEEKVYQILRGRRYLVVMDDIWSRKAWDVYKKVFPDDSNGSRVMITTRLRHVASYAMPSSKLYQMGLLSEDQSWELLKRKVFGDEECPSELENIVKNIASHCKGWPFALMASAFLVVNVENVTTSVTLGADKSRTLETIRDHFLQDFDLEKVIASYDDESRCHPSGKHELRLEKVIKLIDLVAKQVKEEVQYGAHSSTVCSSSTPLSIHTNSFVGLEEHVMNLKGRLCGESSKLQVIPICGMGGIGKTTLARNVYDDPLIMEYFVIRVWVTISQDYTAQRILSSILESLKEYNTGKLGQCDDEKIHKILIGRRYLVVMDDIWSGEAWDIVRMVFPDDSNGSRIMLTTRLSDVASYPDTSSKLYEMSLLNAEQSWELFKQKVFANEDCPSELENIGKRIAGSCRGLPLAIVVIAGLLSTTMRNLVSWKVIAENLKAAETVEHNQIEEILSFSYVQLPQYLRPCFLYMASFLEDEEIHVKKLIRLWVAEGFIKSPTDTDSFEKVAEECLEELVKRNLVLAAKRKWDGRIKSCSLHDLMRDLCIRKSYESKFFLNLMDRHIEKESFVVNIRNQHSVSVYSCNVSSLPGSIIRSIKSSKNHFDGGPDFIESVRLLRVLDASTLDVHDLSKLVHLNELFHLRYLAISSYVDRVIPTSLSMLQNLQTLVIRPGMIMRSARTSLSWCLPQLRHIYIGGTIHFFHPEESTCPLENLQTLSYLSYKSCTERILKLIPNLKRLKIHCSDDDHQKDGVCLNNLVHLHRLEKLEIYGGDKEGEQPRYFNITFPKCLKKLTLKALKVPWDDIFVVGSLPNLQALKLIKCTCVGGSWETTEGAFPELEVLLIQDVLNFTDWITESSHFPKLKFVLLDSCEDLEGITSDIGEISTLEVITVTGGARESLVESVEQIRQEQEYVGNTLKVSIRCQIFSQGCGDDDDYNYDYDNDGDLNGYVKLNCSDGVDDDDDFLMYLSNDLK